METLQKVYRVKLPPDELAIWAGTLKDFSFQEFDNAMKHLISNPPKEQLEDGTIQTWTGMPKLSQVIERILHGRQEAVRKLREMESEQQLREIHELEKRRREHPEEFFSIADVLKEAKVKGMGKVIEMTDAQWNERQNLLREQARKLKAEHGETN